MAKIMFNNPDVVKIATMDFGASVATLTLNNIPQTFRSLELIGYWSAITAGGQVGIRFNGDTGANYDQQELRGSAALAIGVETFGANQLSLSSAAVVAANSPAVASHSMIPGYALGTTEKSLITNFNTKTGVSTGNLRAVQFGGFWRNVAAITSLTIFLNAGGTLDGSSVSVYGRN